MKTIAFKWQTISLLGFFALMTVGVFAQTAQPTDAYYVNPMTCNQLWNACERQRDMGIRPRACSMHATLCGWMGSSASSENSCGPSAILCPPNRMPECSGGRWRCVTAGSSSSSSSMGPNCATTSVLCIEGTMPQCINDQWQCLPPNSSSSTSSDRCIARCADGYEYRTCTEDGHPINYFVDPCFNHSSSSSSLPSATLCEENLCGPRPGMPNWICPDGNSYGGPTGRCLRHQSGACAWEILSCNNPPSSASSSSSSSLGCYCPKIYAPVCGADGRTYGNSCEAGCANVNVASQGACGSVDPVTPQCPVYSLMAPGPGCHYEYTKNERGCDVPNLVCASSSSSQMTCGPSNIRCRQGFEPTCSNGTWRCVRGTASSSSSACAMIDMAAPPPGCRYEGCRFDPNGCYQGGCRLACSSSSVPAPSSCGPSTVLCSPNTSPVCSGGQWSCVPTNGSSSSASSRPTAQNGCKVAGCSSQLCVEEGDSGISTCEYREEYACYRTARCERQATGVCGWTQTQELRSCISNARS